MTFAENKNKFLFMLTFIMNVVNDAIGSPELLGGQVNEDVHLFQTVWASEVRPQLEGLFRQFETIHDETSPLWQEIQSRGFTPARLQLIEKRLSAASANGLDERVFRLTGALLSAVPGADFLKWFSAFVEDEISHKEIPTTPSSN
ncbi:MAG TPA: hypothetical protein VGB69_06425 [Edaphobacter sp.]